MATRIDRLLQIMAYVGVIAIIVVSLVPGSDRPHTGVPGGGHGEHLIAYFLTAFLFGLREEQRSQLFRLGLVLVAGAGILETAQLWIPERNSQISDFISSSTGIVMGLAIGGLLAQFYKNWLASLPS